MQLAKFQIMMTELILYSLIAGLVIFYLIYTIRYTILFKKSSFFTGLRKAFHLIMIWIFPFVWILILKSYLNPIPGSHKFKTKKDPDKMEDNTTGWVMRASMGSDNTYGKQN